LCLVAAGIILVPGVLLLNGVRDMLGSHVGTGISRLTLGAVTVLSIAFGLLLAGSVTGDRMPVEGNPPLLPIAESLLFSALAGIGPAMLFNVPLRAAWACVVCTTVGHGLRSALMHIDLDLAVGSLAGAFGAALLARIFARRYRVPAVTFAFPGVIPLMPGAYAFRTALGALDIMHAGAAASPALIGETIGLAVTTVLVTASIAIGLALALAAPFASARLFVSDAKPPRDHPQPAPIDAA
jgi:uncharacterized membrane protein YjjB (DUF3815 family)